jgi:hypothetical protein
MGLFDIFRKKKPPAPPAQENKDIAPVNAKNTETINVAPLQEVKDLAPPVMDVDFPLFKMHDDLKGLIWIGDGKYKNYTPETPESVVKKFENMIVTFYVGNDKEPSVIYTKQPVKKPDDESLVSRPPYYPTYEGLTPEQKWIYLKLLANPYDASIDVGYVFILYYGLERHLLKGDFEKAFRVIIKLRDVHTNNSFQRYSANALILSAMLHKKGEYVLEFVNSLDKDHEFNFWDNLFLMCYYSFDLPILPKDIMRMYNTFEWTNTNYIKKYPDIFMENLKKAILEKTGQEKILLKNYLTPAEVKNLPTLEDRIFANVSIMDQKIPIPLLTDNSKLKREIYNYLETAHEATKKKLAEMRKAGTLPDIAKSESSKRKKGFDNIVIIDEEEADKGNKDVLIPDFGEVLALDDDQKNIISGYQWLSTLDTVTCINCGVLDGKIFKTIEEIPRHICLNDNCRCVILPYIEGMDVPGERAAVDGPVPDSWTYKKWFSKQKKIVQKRILGTKYFNMYKSRKPLAKIAELINAGKDYRNHGNSWINDYNDEELLECIPEEALQSFNNNDGLKRKLLAIPELGDDLYNDPSEYYFQTIMRLIRKAIKREKEAGNPVDELYETLYSVGVISSVIISFSEKLGIEGDYVLEIMPGGSLLKLPFSYKDIGYEKITLFTKGDCKMFPKLWGNPEAHKTLNEYYPRINSFYENKFSENFLKSKGMLL